MAIHFEAEVVGGDLGLSNETTDFGYFTVEEIERMEMLGQAQGTDPGYARKSCGGSNKIESVSYHTVTAYVLYAIEPNQVILLLILIGSVVLLFTEWIRIDLNGNPDHPDAQPDRRAGAGGCSFGIQQ